jgi:hypothetical protein
MKRWTLLFFSTESYIQKAIGTIQLARGKGEWKDDIVLMIPDDFNLDENTKNMFNSLSVIIKPMPNLDTKDIMDFWKPFPDHPQYSHIMTRPSMYMKICMFDIYMRNWDVVFYLDTGAIIQGPLSRMKEACTPDGIIYAHSDAYPTYEWKLRRQFAFELFTPSQSEEMDSRYNLICNYFQSTIMIFDTKLIEEHTVSNLFELVKKYPNSIRGDQGIFNLYFHVDKDVWRQIPIADKYGFLYDFHERDGHKTSDYLILKYPRFWIF